MSAKTTNASWIGFSHQGFFFLFLSQQCKWANTLARACKTTLRRAASRLWWSACVSLTSFSFSSYLLAFLPWLFLLSFFNSEWDRSRESCFILCSIWYLLKVAFNRESSLLFTQVVSHVSLASISFHSTLWQPVRSDAFLMARIPWKWVLCWYNYLNLYAVRSLNYNVPSLVRQLPYSTWQKFGHTFSHTFLSLQPLTLRIDTEGIIYSNKIEEIT